MKKLFFIALMAVVVIMSPSFLESVGGDEEDVNKPQLDKLV